MSTGLDPDPGHSLQATDAEISELLEGSGSHVEVCDSTANTSVLNFEVYTLALVGCSNFLSTNGVEVGVTICTREDVEQELGDGDNSI